MLVTLCPQQQISFKITFITDVKAKPVYVVALFTCKKFPEESGGDWNIPRVAPGHQ